METVELILLFGLGLVAWRLNTRATVVANQRRRLNEEAEKLIERAQQAAINTLKKSAKYSDKMLDSASKISNEVADEVAEAIDQTAHSEKLLFKESLSRARHENIASWQVMQKEMERQTEEVLAAFKKKLREQLQSELRMMESTAAEYQKKQQAHLAEMVSAKVDKLAKDVLHQAIPLEQQKELVEAAIARYE